MMRSTFAVLVAGLASVVPARASPPSPANSQVDPCIVTCPAGDSVFVAIVRDATGGPFHSGEESELDLCDCPDVRLAPVAGGGSSWLVGCTVRTLTDMDGIARFPVAAGGVCSGATIRMYCDQVTLAIRSSVASFDQNGDMVVDARRGTSDPTADFDCDGVVTGADYDIAVAHLGHADASIVGIGDGPDIAFGVRANPNPTRGPTEFVVRAPVGGRSVLSLHDLTGRRVATVLDGVIPSGVHRLRWPGRDLAGRAVPAGVYFYRLTLGGRWSQGLFIVSR